MARRWQTSGNGPHALLPPLLCDEPAERGVGHVQADLHFGVRPRQRWFVRTQRSAACGAGSLPACFASVSMNGSAAAPGNAQGDGQILELLPVGTHRGRGADKALMRYVWDGKTVQPRDESTLSQLATASGRMNQWFAGMWDKLYRAFLPDPRDVTPDYWEWLQWRLTQRFFSSTMQNLSTQSLLLALGMGAKKTIAASAAINWLLKDGVGRIARMTVATNFGQSFDSDLKRIRFVTSIIFEITIGCEFITPFFPQHFLPLASLANLGKAIALAAFVATAPAFQQALCAGNNLADLTAKNQAQHMMVDMLALAVSASAMYAAKNMKVPALLPLAAYPFLAVCDLCTIYKELKAVQLRTLNRERAEIVASSWHRSSGIIPLPAQVSETERLLLPPCEGRHLLPLDIVPLGQLLGSTPSKLPVLMKRYSDSKYMLDVHQSQMWGGDTSSGQHHMPLWRQVMLPWDTSARPKLQMSISESAHGTDILTGILEAVYLRAAVQQSINAKKHHQQQHHQQQQTPHGQNQQPQSSQHIGNARSATPDSKSQHMQHTQHTNHERYNRSPTGTPCGPLGLPDEEVLALARQAHQRAVQDAPRFIKDLQAIGWKIQPFLLSTNEKEGYVVLDHNGPQKR